VAYDTTIAKPLNATLFNAFTFVYPFGIPVALDFSVTAALSVMMHAHAQIAYDSTDGLELVSSGSYIDVGVTGSLSAIGQIGLFAPPWILQHLPQWVRGKV